MITPNKYNKYNDDDRSSLYSKVLNKSMYICAYFIAFVLIKKLFASEINENHINEGNVEYKYFSKILIFSAIVTFIFDLIRDYECHRHGNCNHTKTLNTNPNYILHKNIIIVLLSYNYAYFYGMILPKFDNPVTQFMIVSLLQRFMCVSVMNNIHRRTPASVHAVYYALYFLGGSNFNNYYYGMALFSIFTSLMWICITEKQWDFAWKHQYVNKKLQRINKRESSNIFYEQAYPKIEIIHLYIVLIIHIIFIIINYY